MGKKGKSIALFGGSFNPPHAGHYEIVRRVARRKAIDEVWVLPVYRHAFAKNRKLAPFACRLRNARTFFKRLGPKVKVKDLEKRLGGVSWTSRLMASLKKQYPTYKFSLVLGADAYRDRKKWRDWDFIRKNVTLVVFPRGRGSPIPNVSSTEIRKG